jgi:hypothetical protein
MKSKHILWKYGATNINGMYRCIVMNLTVASTVGWKTHGLNFYNLA